MSGILLLDVGGTATPSLNILRKELGVEVTRTVIENNNDNELRNCIETATEKTILISGGTGMRECDDTARKVTDICNGRMLQGIANQIYQDPFHTGVAGICNGTLVITIPEVISLEKAGILKLIISDLSSAMSFRKTILVVDFNNQNESINISTRLSQTFDTHVEKVLSDSDLTSLLTTKSLLYDCILVIGGDSFSSRDTAADVILKSGRQLEGMTNQLYDNKINRSASSLIGNCIVSNIPVGVDVMLLTEVLNDMLTDSSQSERLQPQSVSNRPRRSPHEMIDMKLAHQLVEQHTPKNSNIENVNITSSVGKVLVQSIHAPYSHPPFNASIKDGYAICDDDFTSEQLIFSVSNTIGTAGASDILKAKKSNENKSNYPIAYRVSTGAAIPPHCNTVIQVENTALVKEGEGGSEDLIQIIPPGYSITRWQDIRKEGSDIQKEALLIPANSIIQPGDVGIMASMGITSLSVKKSVHVVIMSTGNEIVSPNSEGLRDSVSIFDSNRSIITAVLEQQFHNCYTLTDLGIVSDDLQHVRQAFDKAMSLKPDIIITSGGVSMGEKDFIKTVISSLPNSQTHFQRISMKPGKPTTFVTSNGTAVFGLPGNPVSCLVCFQLFCVPSIKLMLGYSLNESRNSVVTAKLMSSPIKLDTERPEYHRVTVVFDSKTSSFIASSTGRQISSRLLSMRDANALLHLPKGTSQKPTANPGDEFSCTLFGAFRTE